MKNFDEFEIQFVALDQGTHHFEYEIDNSFFELFDYQEFNDAKVHVELELEKKESVLELQFDIDGTVNVNCDVSNEPYDQPIEGVLKLVVKFGEEYDDEDEEILILPYSETRLQVQQFIYEAIILAVPYKKVHPGVRDGSLKSDVLDKLRELSPDHSDEEKQETDPRWDKLKDLLNEN